MEKHVGSKPSTLLGSVLDFLCRSLFFILSFGRMPNHIAFIMDGNRRYAKRSGMKEGAGHRVGFTALISTLQYCYEMGVKYVTIYAFSIDNFKRKPEEVQSVMNLMEEKINELLKEESVVNKYGVRINFWGDLNLLRDSTRLAAERAMSSTAKNRGPVLSVCVAYTSTYEIMRAVGESCTEKKLEVLKGNDTESLISVADLEQHLFTFDCPDPDIVIRTSGETRLSNFLLWQTSSSHLQCPVPLWPEFSLRHLVWAILVYQKACPYLKGISSKSKKESVKA